VGGEVGGRGEVVIVRWMVEVEERREDQRGSVMKSFGLWRVRFEPSFMESFIESEDAITLSNHSVKTGGTALPGKVIKGILLGRRRV